VRLFVKYINPSTPIPTREAGEEETCGSWDEYVSDEIANGISTPFREFVFDHFRRVSLNVSFFLFLAWWNFTTHPCKAVYIMYTATSRRRVVVVVVGEISVVRDDVIILFARTLHATFSARDL